MNMKPEDMERFLAMGGNEEELLRLLREVEMADEDIAATKGHSPTVGAGYGQVVPNIMDPITGMFERGRAKKTKTEAEGAAANNRAAANQDTRAFIESLMQGQKEQEFIHKPGGIGPEAPMPIPSVAPIGGPPPAGPQGPPAPAMGGPPNAAPEPSPEAVSPVAPVKPPVSAPAAFNPSRAAPTGASAPAAVAEKLLAPTITTAGGEGTDMQRGGRGGFGLDTILEFLRKRTG